MNFDKLIDDIEYGRERRDHLLDDLTDALASSNVSESEATEIVDRIESLVPVEVDSSEQESFFNLLSTLYFLGRAMKSIERIMEERIYSLDVASLAHCVEILLESHIPNKDKLLKELRCHQSPAIRELASE